ncbi:MAG: hypothetical protein ABIF71_05745 [Planctomycetota bacterium]
MVGYADGFCPLLKRGAKLGYSVPLTQDIPLIHSGVETLALYADYHDGDEVFYLGWFDLTKPSGKTVEPFTHLVPEKSRGDNFFLVLSITENRDLLLIRPQTGQVYQFIEKTDLPSAQENPFSGAF